LPSLRDNLELHVGVKAVVNLTLSTFFEAMQWLPAQRRRPGDAADDWKWTLRSATNRPILRMLEDGPLIMVSSTEDEHVHPVLEARVAVTGGDEFGEGGVHNVFTVDRASGDGNGMILRADLSAPGVGSGTGSGVASEEIAAGYEKQISPLASLRMATDLADHPEIVGAPGMAGMQSIGMQAAEEMRIAQSAVIDVGNESTILHMANQMATEMQPFADVTLHISDPLMVQYRMATSRDLQGWSDMDRVQPAQQTAVLDPGGNLLLERGLHQEMNVTRNVGRGRISAAVFHDNMTHPALNGSGDLAGSDFAAGDVAADPATETFRMLGSGYTANGFRVSMIQPLTNGVRMSVGYANGEALAMTGDSAASLNTAMLAMQAQRNNAFDVAIESHITSAGTYLSTSYRWQAANTMTAVDAYGSFSDRPYLGCTLRQPIRWRGVAPKGMVAMVNVTNLLAQGYRPVLSADGRTLYFAQSPRLVSAGLTFNF
jgi:hypothetical protein